MVGTSNQSDPGMAIDLVQYPIQIQIRSVNPSISSSKMPSNDINVSARDVPGPIRFVDVFYGWPAQKKTYPLVI